MTIKKAASTIIGGIVSAGALYLAFRNVPVADLIAYMHGIDYRWVLPAVALVVLLSLLRSLRWQFIVSSVDRIGFADAFHPLMIGFMINCILPGRVGELTRPAVLARRSRVAYATGLATVGIERAMDALFLIGAFALIVSHLTIDPTYETVFAGYRLTPAILGRLGSGLLKLGVVLVAAILLIRVDASRRWFQRVLRNAPRLLWFLTSHRRDRITAVLVDPVITWIDQVAIGFSLLRSPRTVMTTAALTIVIWLVSALSYYVMAQGCPGIAIGFVEHLAAMIILCFCIALPSVPGFWGIWEAGGVFALTVLGVGVDEAAGFTLINHVVQIVPVILMGWASAVITGISIMTVTAQKQDIK